MSHRHFAALAALATFLNSAAAMAAPSPNAPDAVVTAKNLLDYCASPTNTGSHAMCLVMVGSVMDGIDIATIAARNKSLKPAICLPADLDRQTVINSFIYAMGTGKGSYNDEKAVLVLGAMLMGNYPCK